MNVTTPRWPCERTKSCVRIVFYTRAGIWFKVTGGEETVRSIDPATLAEPSQVGRKRLPTTVIGLITHISEHAQPHLGQAISAAKLARAG